MSNETPKTSAPWSKRLLRLALFCYFTLFVLLIVATGFLRGLFAAPEPQPIAFPHTTHAGKLGLACDFCHSGVTQEASAGAPAVSLCLSCHRAIATDRPQIKKLLEYENRGEPIRWERLHALPPFIHFTHQRHIQAKLPCATCHGAVEQMAQVQRVRSLKMGWCVSCHRSRGASRDCATCHK